MKNIKKLFNSIHHFSKKQPHQPSTITKGKIAQNIAERFLHQQGYITITQNYHCQYGEIDLIMKNASTLVIVEVRSKSSSYFGHPLATINYQKQHKIIKTTQYYLLHHPKQTQFPIRFDAISITKNQQISWIKDAFSLTGH